MLSIGSVLLAAHALMMLAIPALCYIVVAVVEATAHAFISGADSALLYDSLQGDGGEGRYLQVSSRLMAAQSIVTGVSIALGSALVEVSWALPFGLTSAVCTAQLLIALSIRVRETPLTLTQARRKDGGGLLDGLRRMAAPIVSSAGAIIVVFGLLDGVYGGFYSLNQLVFDKLGIAAPGIGVFFSVSYLVNSASYLAAERLATAVGKGRLLKVLLIAELALLVSTLGVYSYPLPFMVVAFMACILPEMIYVLAEADVQARIPDQYRNTSLSLLSLMYSLASSAMFVGAGFLLDGAGVAATLTLIALSAGGITGVYLFSVRRPRHADGRI